MSASIQTQPIASPAGTRLSHLKVLPTMAVAISAALVIAASNKPAHGGAVLISRQSYIRAAGGPNGFDLSDGTTTFGQFANNVTNLPDGGSGMPGGTGMLPVVSEAHQYSMPGVMDNGLQGAFAEGSVKADINGPNATAMAVSHFDLTFRITGSTTRYEFGAAMGTAGGGTVTAELVTLPSASGSEMLISRNLTTDNTVFLTTIAKDESSARTLDKIGMLDPGLYSLRVHADSSGTSDTNSAYYSVNLALTPSAVAVPLPPGVFMGIGVLATLAGAYFLRKRAASPV